MGAIALVLLLALVLAATVIVYAAYPYRGRETPVSPGLGRALQRGVDTLPVLEPQSRPRVDDEVPAPR